ncbi:MAG TPA: hypothetical protein VMX55_03955 [candidate division Zixibacteria bacterium]|nr:hypothetical protein [candidate division Zixibacteria bacterium]
MPNIINVLTVINGGNELSIALDSSDIWWIVIIAILGFFMCACCCVSTFLNFLRPWRFRRRGMAPPVRRGVVRWWRQYPHHPDPRAPTRRWRR